MQAIETPPILQLRPLSSTFSRTETSSSRETRGSSSRHGSAGQCSAGQVSAEKLHVHQRALTDACSSTAYKSRKLSVGHTRAGAGRVGADPGCPRAAIHESVRQKASLLVDIIEEGLAHRIGQGGMQTGVQALASTGPGVQQDAVYEDEGASPRSTTEAPIPEIQEEPRGRPLRRPGNPLPPSFSRLQSGPSTWPLEELRGAEQDSGRVNATGGSTNAAKKGKGPDVPLDWHWAHRADTAFADPVILPPLEEVTRGPVQHALAPAPQVLQPSIVPATRSMSLDIQSTAESPQNRPDMRARVHTASAIECHLIAPAANSTVLNVALMHHRGPSHTQSATSSPRTKLGQHFWKLGQRLGFAN